MKVRVETTKGGKTLTSCQRVRNKTIMTIAGIELFPLYSDEE